VQIRSRSEAEGGKLIHDWIRSHYPTHAIQSEKNFEEGEHAYHMVTLKGPDAVPHTVYFDISTYYRRMGSSKFPKPLT